MRTRISRYESDEAGFTLIELLIVIVILGILAGIVIFAVGNSKDDATAAACKANQKTVRTAAEAYKAKNGSYPGSLTTTGFLTDTGDLVAANYTSTTGSYSC